VPDQRPRLAGVPDPVTVRVPAKVNLHLGVGRLRPDGFHPVTTVLQAVSLYDEITATAAARLSVQVKGEGAGQVPLGEDNLAARAARVLAERAGVGAGVHLSITKAIPVAAGMAGGSADAAAALVACDALWQTGLHRDELTELAAGLGSDVPFGLTGGTALGSGRGERLSPVLAKGQYHWVFALADGGLSTSAVYAERDRMQAEVPAVEALPPAEVIAALRAGDAAALGRVLTNDLQAPALRLRPTLARTLEAGSELGVLGAVVSGSGPTCAFLARSSQDAIRLAASLAGAGVCRTVRRGVGPVIGARIIDPA